MCVVKVVLGLLLTTFAANAFLFPDLKLRTGGSVSNHKFARRTSIGSLEPERRERPLPLNEEANQGSASSAKYRIAVIQEEPYLFANGSGYVADLMNRIAESYASIHEGNEFSYDIVSVRTWSQLMMASARSSSRQVSFGLVVPSLELSPWNGRHLQISAPTMYTSVKVVSKKGKNMDDDTRQLRDSIQAVVLRGSPLEYVLVRANNYRGPVQGVDSMEEAEAYLRSNYDAALLTSAGVADHLAAKASEDLQSTCAKRIPGTSPLFYAFFGRDSKLIGQLNEVIVQLMSTDDGPLLSIYSKYFSSTRQCLW